VCDGQRYLVGVGGDSVQTMVAMGAVKPIDAVPIAKGFRANGCEVVAQPAIGPVERGR